MESLESLCKVSVIGGEIVRPKVSYLPSEHQSYEVDGKKVCGASTIAGRDPDGKNMLIGWANKMGLKGICTNAFLKHSANIGTMAHKMVEFTLSDDGTDVSYPNYKSHPNYDIYYQCASKCEQKFADWWSDHPSFKTIATELPLTSKIFGYGGTIDIYGQLGDKKVLIDIKTSNAVYMSHKLQVAGYSHLLEENDYEVDEVYILQISRDPDTPYHFERVGDIESYFGVFQELLHGYNAHKDLKVALKSERSKEEQALHDAWLENLRRG